MVINSYEVYMMDKKWKKRVYMKLRKKCIVNGLDYKVAGNMQQFAKSDDEMAVADYYSKIYIAERELEAIIGD